MWDKRGLIFKINNQWDWVKSHACVPTAIELENVIRVYFAPRNKKGQSIPVFIDVDKENPDNILRISEKPIIDLGEVGTFDDGGIMPCSIIKKNGLFYMYYVGWNPSVSVPYRNSIGLIISEDGENFKRLYKGPVIDRNLNEPFFTASPCVMFEDGIWKIWYASSTGFVKVGNGGYSPLYHIKYAESIDGVNWDRNNISCITPKNEFECTARPSLIKENGIYKMWYCYRGSFDYRDGEDSYKIGYAESFDGVNWDRMDEKVGIQLSEEGFDSKMMTYPSVIDVNGDKHMFYNGNSFGKEGIGLATHKNDKKMIKNG